MEGEQETETPVATERQRNNGSLRKEDRIRVTETGGCPIREVLVVTAETGCPRRAVFVGTGGECHRPVVERRVMVVESDIPDNLELTEVIMNMTIIIIHFL